MRSSSWDDAPVLAELKDEETATATPRSRGSSSGGDTTARRHHVKGVLKKWEKTFARCAAMPFRQCFIRHCRTHK